MGWGSSFGYNIFRNAMTSEVTHEGLPELGKESSQDYFISAN